MENNSALPPIEQWWPHLSIEGKHELQADLEAELSHRILEEIELALSCNIERLGHRLSTADHDFIRTQGEMVD